MADTEEEAMENDGNYGIDPHHRRALLREIEACMPDGYDAASKDPSALSADVNLRGAALQDDPRSKYTLWAADSLHYGLAQCARGNYRVALRCALQAAAYGAKVEAAGGTLGPSLSDILLALRNRLEDALLPAEAAAREVRIEAARLAFRAACEARGLRDAVQEAAAISAVGDRAPACVTMVVRHDDAPTEAYWKWMLEQLPPVPPEKCPWCGCETRLQRGRWDGHRRVCPMRPEGEEVPS